MITTPAPSTGSARPAPHPAVPPVPRWARVAAHVAALTPLPSALWRIALALGFSGGYTSDGLEELNLNVWGTLGVLGLSVATEGAALLTLGLVQKWGEVVPGWVPVLGGRRVSARVVVPAAWAGVVVLALLWTQMAFWWQVPHDDMTTTGANVVGLLYLPMVAWAPLLGAVTVDYRRRHRAAR